jgi:hypothetical protein
VSGACRVFGHQPVFSTDGPVMNWECGRCGGERGSKAYTSPEAATRYAAAFNRRDSDDLGKRAPLLGLLPLRLWRMAQQRRSTRG